MFGQYANALGTVFGEKRAFCYVTFVQESRLRAEQLPWVSGKHVRAHTGVRGKEVADALANAGRKVRGICALWAKYDGTWETAREAVVDCFTLEGSLVWAQVIEREGKVKKEIVLEKCVEDLCLVSLNVNTLHPGEEKRGPLDSEQGGVSHRRWEMADTFGRLKWYIVGLQECRSNGKPMYVEGYDMFSAPATPQGQGGVELWSHHRLKSTKKN